MRRPVYVGCGAAAEPRDGGRGAASSPVGGGCGAAVRGWEGRVVQHGLGERWRGATAPGVVPVRGVRRRCSLG